MREEICFWNAIKFLYTKEILILEGKLLKRHSFNNCSSGIKVVKFKVENN